MHVDSTPVRATGMDATRDHRLNGVNLDTLRAARRAFAEIPAAAAFVWRATGEWMSGTHTCCRVGGFYGLGHDRGRVGHLIDTDHPEIFGADDLGMTPPEAVLGALAGCLTASIATIATNRGMRLHSVTTSIEGDMDLRGALGAHAGVRSGFESIRVHVDIDADASDDEVDSLIAQARARSAVHDLITDPTPVHIGVDREPGAR